MADAKAKRKRGRPAKAKIVDSIELPEAPVTRLEGVDKFIRIIEHPLLEGEHHRGYQLEEVLVKDEKITSRRLIGDKDLVESALAHAMLALDPRIL